MRKMTMMIKWKHTQTEKVVDIFIFIWYFSVLCNFFYLFSIGKKRLSRCVTWIERETGRKEEEGLLLPLLHLLLFITNTHTHIYDVNHRTKKIKRLIERASCFLQYNTTTPLMHERSTDAVQKYLKRKINNNKFLFLLFHYLLYSSPIKAHIVDHKRTNEIKKQIISANGSKIYWNGAAMNAVKTCGNVKELKERCKYMQRSSVM